MLLLKPSSQKYLSASTSGCNGFYKPSRVPLYRLDAYTAAITVLTKLNNRVVMPTSTTTTARTTARHHAVLAKVQSPLESAEHAVAAT
jgi:hypothetical protein